MKLKFWLKLTWDPRLIKPKVSARNGKTTSIIFTSSSIECQMVYKNMELAIHIAACDIEEGLFLFYMRINVGNNLYFSRDSGAILLDSLV